ncbi:chemotaxis protein [Campylobacter hyointestinalis]|uniref:Chemotaxis protein CheV n=2 Tax=Campylobacter hyointestinalis TaxID=198 RepID=A0AAV6EGU6_CAMHY|nr:chemotaxis protein [Campylobacter hyointestinalis]ANE33684.1 chemotaxis signal transduction protein CheV [Campylobacter hyointestinalis subsp. lawsonii CCUG 27631]KAB0614332.1 chemotaxis protein CheV [Campylobacter hyointestinalis subsp. lawsonii]QKF70083.1 chemotaxis signal transduction protein CheV [Campylobacter hyointestinalis subsp. lawsonii]RAZ25033.1 chemotaxis protein CheV [Campylobacter hyointestinalis subsp. lawsonii]RAZ28949.1 chemotaxis protein CheV [Campylobacter hyointestinali
MFDDNILKTGSNEMELVDFRIFKQGKDRVYEGIYGVNVAKVKEIIKMPNLTELPGVPDYIEGIFDLRGVVIPVINLAKWMNIIEPKDSILKPRVIIAEFSDIFIGFIVHEAKRIRRINWKDIEPANFSGGVGNGTLDKSKITGVTRIENDEVLLILDLESIVEELGIYQPKIEMEVDEMTQLSGIALVLDDSLTARRLVGDALTKMGLRVVEAKDGAEGLEKINDLYALYKDDLDQNLRVIISDIEMPQMDGFHFAASLKEDNRFSNIPIIFNSSLSNEFSEMHGKEAGADGYLTKFNATQLYKEVIKVIDAHKKYLDKR